MINWNVENTYYLAMLVSSILAIFVYYLFFSKKGRGKK